MLKLQANLQFQASPDLAGPPTLGAKFKLQLKVGQVHATSFYEIDGRVSVTRFVKIYAPRRHIYCTRA